ncbi:ATPase domain-containing protein [Allorhodopirellula heiligendammensis]|uniref:non-specific serine/threonine protein kinase n=1 Tax=Allorhodopirellula heiligendammensis TaxID=2714739 RepID=A0A5C6BG12_9BACT|nr:ATPase domain-containing protein [Allorhodopirellula heiligendammensis]TWU10577.1 Circadian clock protein kinase KaiC [Allorhodopirellula heiligendammensis]
MAASNLQTKISSGISALDDILHGGLISDRMYLIEGMPGTGKTTLALQFLLEGARQGDRGLYVTLSETKEELEGVAQSHGWSLNNVDIHELVGNDGGDSARLQYTMFEPAEIELGTTVDAVLERVNQLQPKRVIFDSLSEMRLLSQGSLRYRRQILALKQFFVGRGCTVLLLDDYSGTDDQHLQSIAHGVIRLEHLLSDYGGERRRLRIIKHRGTGFIGGAHDVRLVRGGLKVYPREVPPDTHATVETSLIDSGNREFDELLGGGLNAGTSALLLGPAGVGKSSMALQFAISAAKRNERSVLFQFEESRQSLFARAEGLGFDLQKHFDEGLIQIINLSPGEITPSEFACLVRDTIQLDNHGRHVGIVAIDSINGYLNSMPHEKFLIIQMHEMLQFLGERGILTLVVVAQHGMLGQTMATPVDASYLADSVVLFRYFEARGEIRQAISVLKKRTGRHERTIREFKLSSRGIEIGPPLNKFSGILTGVPVFTGEHEALIEKENR